MVYVVGGQVRAGHKPQGGDEYKREPTVFAHQGPLDISDGSEMHLYVCAACPWAHRALITRNLSATLRAKVTVSVVSPFRDDAHGWDFLSEDNKARVGGFTALPVTADASLLQAKTLLEVYLAASPEYTGNITTPTLYDARSNRIVSNDSFGIMRAFVATVPEELGSLYVDPETTDREGRTMDEELGKRVYMCGLAKSQSAYERSLTRVFAELGRLEALLGDGRAHLLGNGTLSLADVQLIACLLRFDPVYFGLFKCFTRRLSSYPFLSAWARRVAAEVGPAALSLDLDQIVHHYYTTFTSCNPNGVVPLGYRGDFLDGGIDKFREPTVAVATAVAAAAVGASGAVAVAVTSAGVDQDQTNAAARRARGEFVRGVSAHRNWLGDAAFPTEPNRYILFVANNCPWCHRTMMARAMYPGVEDLVRASVMFYRRGGPDNRWRFLPDDPAELMDYEAARPELLEGVDREDPTGNGCAYAPDIYRLSEPDSGESSVPILFDTRTRRVVSNESADIVRMFAMASDSFNPSLLPQIDAVNARVYADVNNGAYKAGFTSSQASHEDAVAKYFTAFDWLNGLLSKSKYLVSNEAPTEADLRLFPTVYRHDPVYHARMKLNVAMVRDYPHLNRWLLDMKADPAVQRGSRLEHCVAGYFGRTGNNLCPFVGLDHDGVRPY